MTKFGPSPMHEVQAELVATVLEVTAVLGDRVEPDTMLVLLDSMKMEIPVLAGVDGVLAELKVIAGDVVAAGDVIAVVALRRSAEMNGV
jgi:acetyl-CoA carboxylase biotin carboxyl carrier protein